MTASVCAASACNLPAIFDTACHSTLASGETEGVVKFHCIGCHEVYGALFYLQRSVCEQLSERGCIRFHTR
jgi:hypothetical protein